MQRGNDPVPHYRCFQEELPGVNLGKGEVKVKQKLSVSKYLIEGFHVSEGVGLPWQVLNAGVDTVVPEAEAALAEDGTGNYRSGGGMAVCLSCCVGAVAVVSGLGKSERFEPHEG